MRDQKSYFPALTGLRFLAAFLVLVFHYERANPIYPELIQAVLSEMYIGVSLFFVLSGFLIAHRYFIRDSDTPSPVIRIYLLNRFARIFPLLFVLSAITFLVRILFNERNFDSEWTIFLLNITLLKGFSKDFFLGGITQSWSLSVEELFYLLAPIIFLFIRKNLFWLVGLPIIFLGTGLLVVRFFSIFPFHGFFEDTSFMLMYTFFGRSIEFFTGISMAILLKQNVTPKLPFPFTWIGLTLTCLTVSMLIFSKGDLEFGFQHSTGLVLHNLVLPVIGFGPLIWGLITEKTWLSNLLSNGFMQLLGRSSYALYLLHLGVFQGLLSRISTNFLFIFPAIVLLSVAFYYWVEEPLNKVTKMLFSSLTPKKDI